jgi:hypothetical protein
VDLHDRIYGYKECDDKGNKFRFSRDVSVEKTVEADANDSCNVSTSPFDTGGFAFG